MELSADAWAGIDPRNDPLFYFEVALEILKERRRKAMQEWLDELDADLETDFG